MTARLSWAATTLALLLVGLPSMARAHDLRPAFLAITETSPHKYQVLWKVPTPLEGRLRPQLPQECQAGAAQGWHEYGFSVSRWPVDCGAAGLEGKTLAIGGLDSTLTDALLRLELSERDVETHRLTPDEPRYRVTADNDPASTLVTFFGLGVGHLLLGFDHLLFIFTLVWLVRGWRRLALAVTAFTLAHSLTLALWTFGVVRPEPAIIEVLIAMSIVLLAYEVARRQHGLEGFTSRYPAIVTLLFGLLHGFGFAGALQDIGLPRADIPTALVSFNLGLEFAQLLFVAALLGLGAVGRRLDLAPPLQVSRLSVYGVGSLASFWMIERLAALPIVQALSP